MGKFFFAFFNTQPKYKLFFIFWKLPLHVLHILRGFYFLLIYHLDIQLQNLAPKANGNLRNLKRPLFVSIISISARIICINLYLVFPFYVYDRVCPGTIIVFFDYPNFSSRSSSLSIVTNAANGTCLFGWNIGVASSFSSNFDFILEQNPRPSEKISGKFILSSLFSFFGVDWRFVNIITKRVYWYVEQVERFQPFAIDSWQMRLIFSLSLRKKHLWQFRRRILIYLLSPNR